MSDMWRVELQQFILSQARVPHIFGRTDCLCFCAGGVQIKRRVDYMAQFRGHYGDYPGAIAMIRELGYEEPIDYVASLFKDKLVMDAGDGDIGAIWGEDGTIAFGLFMRDKVFVRTLTGLGKLSRSKAFRAFEVPEWQQLSPPA